MKAELLDLPVTCVLEMWFWINIQSGWSICTKKALIQLREVCTDLTLFKSRVLKRWMGVCLRTPKQRWSFLTRNDKHYSLLDKSRGMGDFSLKHMLWGAQGLESDRSLQTLAKWRLLVKLLLLLEWKEPILFLPHITWSVYFSRYVSPRSAANL